jgi:hypothetical protein
MKKITVLMLVLGLAVPAQAWTLFPVRKEVVTETKTNYAAMAGACVITLVLSLIAGKLIFGYKAPVEPIKPVEPISKEEIRRQIELEINMQVSGDNNGAWRVVYDKDAESGHQWVLKWRNYRGVYIAAKDAISNSCEQGRREMKSLMNNAIVGHRLIIEKNTETRHYQLHLVFNRGYDAILVPLGDDSIDIMVNAFLHPNVLIDELLGRINRKLNLAGLHLELESGQIRVGMLEARNSEEDNGEMMIERYITDTGLHKMVDCYRDYLRR